MSVARGAIGGASNTFEAYTSMPLRKLLEENRVAYARDLKLDPYAVLPSWLHPR